MAYFKLAVLLSTFGAAFAVSSDVGSQPITLPAVQECRDTHASGLTSGVLENRKDAQHSGQFRLTFDLGCSGASSDVQVRNLEIHAQELADSDKGIERVISEDGPVKLVSIGPAMAPTVFVSGPCRGGGPNGCQFWLMLVDNGSDSGTASDLVSFLVSDKSGKRLAYGTGPIKQGDVLITKRQ
jgi:hypothetical protein